MKRVIAGIWVAVTALSVAGFSEKDAEALVDDTPMYSPPNGWNQLCAGNTIDVKPTPGARLYTGTGTCWINLAEDKSDPNKQNWVRSAVTLDGRYVMQRSVFEEKLTFTLPTGTVPVTRSGSCVDDPWEKGGQCGSSPINVDLGRSFGWTLQLANGPLSANVFGPALVSAMLAKQASVTPLAPVDVDAVRWPEANGTVGRIFWRAPDVSGNRWILVYEIEHASSPDSAFAVAGRVVGPGAKSSLSPKDVSRYFYTPTTLGAGADYFRVCATNDAGRQCSGAIVARQPTRTELMAVGPRQRVNVVMGAGGSPPIAAGGAPPTAPGRPAAPIAVPAPALRPVGPLPR
jgi:hypothetical protein